MGALRALRVPPDIVEFDIYFFIDAALTGAGISFRREVPLAPRSRIDYLAGAVGIEVKRGRWDRRRIEAQLRRYAGCDAVAELILVTERAVRLPPDCRGKPVHVLPLRKLWGVALP
ncbi:MAG: hypothetical protein M0Z27_09840 [Thermaerobacter sp.]|nr:hypothetical protein [Thermaerobacter sp.]